jgi:hypothetical protein
MIRFHEIDYVEESLTADDRVGDRQHEATSGPTDPPMCVYANGC